MVPIGPGEKYRCLLDFRSAMFCTNTHSMYVCTYHCNVATCKYFLVHSSINVQNVSMAAYFWSDEFEKDEFKSDKFNLSLLNSSFSNLSHQKYMANE